MIKELNIELDDKNGALLQEGKIQSVLEKIKTGIKEIHPDTKVVIRIRV